MSYGEFPRSTTYTRTQSTWSGTNDPQVGRFNYSYMWTNTRFGSSVFRWWQKISLGISAMSSFQATLTEIQSSEAYGVQEFYTTANRAPASYRKREVSGHIRSMTLPSNSYTTEEVAGAENRAREKFYANLRKKQNGFQSGVFLGELRETLHMIRNPAKALRTGVDRWYSFVSKNKRRAGKTTDSKNKFLSQTWLEYSYGLAPLISDVRNGYEALSERQARLNRIMLNIRPEETVESSSVITGPHSGNAAVQFSYSEQHDVEVMVRYYGAIKNSALNSFIPDVKYWGFDPTLIIPTIWELTPYSFLIDYFTNIGNVLDSWSQRNVYLAWGGRTERRTRTVSYVDFRPTDLDDSYVKLQNYIFAGKQSASVKTVYRSEVQAVPIPGITYTIPGLTTQWINIGALTRQKSSWKFFFN